MTNWNYSSKVSIVYKQVRKYKGEENGLYTKVCCGMYVGPQTFWSRPVYYVLHALQP